MTDESTGGEMDFMAQQQQQPGPQRRHVLAGMSAWLATAMAGAHGGHAFAAEGDAVPVGTPGRAGIHPSIEPGDRVAADVFVDGKVVGKFDHQATADGIARSPVLVFPLPVGLKRVRLRGKATLEGKSRSFDTTWKVRDLGPILGPLYDQGRPWIERVRGVAAKAEFITVTPGDGGARKKPARAAFADLEKSLGVPLPLLVKVLGDWQIQLGDSGFQSAADMAKVTDMLLRDWDYQRTGPRGLDKILPRAVRARYDRSVSIYIEVGDGLGALAWDPAGVTPGELPNSWYGKGQSGAQPGPAGEGVWFWMHQEQLHKPVLLLDEEHRPRRTESVLNAVFQSFVFLAPSESEADDELVVDTANPRPNLLQLGFDTTGQPDLSLRSYDYQYGLY